MVQAVSTVDTHTDIQSQSKTILTVENITIQYGHYTALNNASLQVKEKEVLALVGPSGCGKSSLLNSINRMTDMIPNCQVSGKVMFDDQNILGHHIDINNLRKKIGMVFQKPNPFPKSIYDNVSYGPRIHGLATNKYDLDEIVESSLAKAGLWDEVKDRLDQPGTGLSGGQQQRLCIARTIAVIC